MRMVACAAALAMSLSACSGMSDTQQRTLTGGAAGAAGGAAIGALAGNAGTGALIGGLAGTAAGWLFGAHKGSEIDAYHAGYDQARADMGSRDRARQVYGDVRQ